MSPLKKDGTSWYQSLEFIFQQTKDSLPIWFWLIMRHFQYFCVPYFYLYPFEHANWCMRPFKKQIWSGFIQYFCRGAHLIKRYSSCKKGVRTKRGIFQFVLNSFLKFTILNVNGRISGLCVLSCALFWRTKHNLWGT